MNMRDQGDLLHLDTKKLGRIAGLGHRITGRLGNVNRHKGIGWDCLHVAVDDHSTRRLCRRPSVPVAELDLGPIVCVAHGCDYPGDDDP